MKPHPAPGETYFSVHGRHERHVHPRRVEARSFEEAAVAFVERWHPEFDAEGDVSVMVADEHGVQRCFRIDVASGAAAPCN